MNLSKTQTNELLFVGFNQDYGCFACGTDTSDATTNTADSTAQHSTAQHGCHPAGAMPLVSPSAVLCAPAMLCVCVSACLCLCVLWGAVAFAYTIGQQPTPGSLPQCARPLSVHRSPACVPAGALSRSNHRADAASSRPLFPLSPPAVLCRSDPFKETFQRDFHKGGIGCVEMLFRCNILALVGGGKNPRYPLNKVMIWDDHQNRCIGELSFRSEVRAVKLRRDRVVVVLEYKIYVYNFADLKLVDHIETTQNTKGRPQHTRHPSTTQRSTAQHTTRACYMAADHTSLTVKQRDELTVPLAMPCCVVLRGAGGLWSGLCALCPLSSNTVLVCPGLQKGHVRCELYDQKKTTLIEAHESSLACFALNFDGSRLATASETGTLIRIFDTTTGQPLQEVRRGADKAEIYSIAFNQTSQWLACSSDRGTIHIFALKGATVGGGAASQQALAATETKDDGGSAVNGNGNGSVGVAGSVGGAGSLASSVPSSPSSVSVGGVSAGGKKHNPTSSLSFLKSVLPKYFSSEWSFAQFRVPDVRTIVAFGNEKNSIVIASADGTFYKALFDPDKPGQEAMQDQVHTFTKHSAQQH